MAKGPQDGLFEQSTMTFGAHLEELRSALIKALMGLLFGFLIGLCLASHVVKMIQAPLVRSLKQYYEDKSEIDLAAQFNGIVPPEFKRTIEQEGVIPDSAQLVDPLEFLNNLASADPENFGHLRQQLYRLRVTEVGRDRIKKMCADLTDVDDPDQPPATRLVWSLLSNDDQGFVESLIDCPSISEEDLLRFVGVLNAVLDKRELHEGVDLDQVGLKDNSLGFSEALARQLESEIDPEKSRRLNRILISAMFKKAIDPPMLSIVKLPTWKPVEVQVIALSAQEAFMIWLKAALVSGIVISSPVMFWYIWWFVAAGLYRHERRYVYVFLPFSVILFLAGVVLAFYFVFDPVLSFLFGFNRWLNIDPDPRISEWLGFVLFLPIGFGISFQLPLVILFLERIGVFTIENYLTRWRIAILAIFVLSMLLTPADPISMLLMAVPLTFLYFGGIVLCFWMPSLRRPAEIEEY